MKKNIPLIVIIASLVLIVVNFIISEKIDRGFWLRTLSSVLLIFSMILTIRDRKKQEKKNN